MRKESASSQESPPIDEKFLLLQPCTVGETPSYLAYMAPEGEKDGRFVQEEGGVVWFSERYPEGEPCVTELISKELGDSIVSLLNKKIVPPKKSFWKR